MNSMRSSKQRRSTWPQSPLTRRRPRAGPGGDSARATTRPGLNFGDCFSYALAESEREPLLFKGEDFARTDIEAS